MCSATQTPLFDTSRWTAHRHVITFVNYYNKQVPPTISFVSYCNKQLPPISVFVAYHFKIELEICGSKYRH